MSAERVQRAAATVTRAGHLATSMLRVRTQGQGFVDLTRDVQAFLAEIRAQHGLATLFIRHTSASLTIQENADPSVLADLLTSLDRLAPQDGGWTHSDEGPDDMPGHIRTMLTSTSLQVPVIAGALALGTWQALYLIEHRARPHRREVVLQFMGALEEV